MSQGLSGAAQHDLRSLCESCAAPFTCRAPFLLKEDTHCMRRHISSATDSTILDRTRGTRSLETVKTLERQRADQPRDRSFFSSVLQFACVFYLSVNGDDVHQSFLQVVPHT